MAIKMKRGTTDSWKLGPELVDFGHSVTKDKDSVIRAEGTELEMYVYTTSANEWWTDSPGAGGQSTGKIPGLPIDFGIEEWDYDKTYRLVVDFEGPEDCNFELVGWYGSLVQPSYSNEPYIDDAYQGSARPRGFVKWPAEKVGVAAPVLVKIRVSYREVGAYEELEEGQLGLEYTSDGQVKLKAGLPGIKKWNELPYIVGELDQQAIIDVVELPTDNINTKMLYRLHSATWVAMHEAALVGSDCYCVDALPVAGIPALDLTTMHLTVYYNLNDKTVYAYIDDMLASTLEQEFSYPISPNEWYDFTLFTPFLDFNYGGVITSRLQITDSNTAYILLSYELYHYYNGEWLSNQLEQIQSDWLQEDSSQPDYIKNKPEIAQTDWNIANESNLAAIKNKPFGIVEQIVDIVPEAEYGFYKPTDTTTDIVCFSIPDFNENSSYNVWFNDIYLGVAKSHEMIAIPNGHFYFSSGVMVIYGGNYPEGNYKVHIVEKQGITKKLDSQWLNLCTDLNNLYGNLNPVTGDLLAEVRSEFGTWQAILNQRLDLSTGPVPDRDGADAGKVLTIVGSKPTWQAPASGLPSTTEASEGALLQIVNGTPTWVSITNGNEVAY